MEFSSPLASMRPQAGPAWCNRKDLPVPRSYYCNPYQTFGPNSFNFKDLSMQQQQQQPKPAPPRDYFTLKPARSSSPTSSLTADLDANFHIDKSPQAPTPRRSLFQTNIFAPKEDGNQMITPPIAGEGVTTPPVPSSSPYGDMMDVSPLPHKPPFYRSQVTLPSPTPEETPAEQDSYISENDLATPQEAPTPSQAPSSAQSFLAPLPERRRPATRPSLVRHKPYTTNNVPQRPQSAENPLPAFCFGNVATHGVSSTPNPLKSCPDSPAESSTPSGGSMLQPRRPSLSNFNRANGSPSTNHVRKQSAGRPNFVRPQRKVMRRSLSMFQHPDDIMREDEEHFESPSRLASVMDVDQQEHQPILPHFTSSEEPDGLPRISQETLLDVLDNKYNDRYDQIKIIDCRFEYEYSGGHIENAINRNDKHDLAAELFDANTSSSSTLIVFHCEYSVHRAPLTAKFIRSHDRNVNAANYPQLTYPELYILDGGYSKFFANHQAKCFPQNYVEMNDQRHEQACERGMAKVKGRQKLIRAQTYAFGQQTGGEEMEDSPTAQGRTLGPRSHSSLAMGSDIGEGMTESLGQSFARRIASY
ncbi:hypothetical protein D0863_16094 [Hortaea werneckii]|uniref:M-phase inducer phosphatase n=1 Tax=Hortaea werneckii TaxID=91943 RepID=A0A3M7BZF5_HORWE|nr:hypothetical protein D0863_16094 [Hortaea werneckii]